MAIVVLTYTAYSIKDRSWFNLLTPQLFLAIPSLYIAQFARLSLGLDEPASVGSWVFVFACYCIPFAFFAFTLLFVKVPQVLEIRHRRLLEIRMSPWVFLAFGIVLYLPVAIEFRADLLNPRAIYEQTRTGYGVNFFLSTMLTTLGFILYLFKSRKFLNKLTFFVVCATLSLAHGSKGLILNLAMMWLIHWRYADGHRMGLRQTAAIFSSLAVGLVAMFYFFSSGIEINELGNFIVGYSDYTGNGIMVVESDRPALFGRIFFEDNIYSRLPRIVFPEKPKNFGSFLLAQEYFPESFELDQGAPAFGIGVPFADFKWLALPILCCCSIGLALLTRAYQNALARFRQPSDFVVFTFLCGVPLFSLGVGFLLPEHLILAAFVTIVLGVRFWPSRCRVSALPAT